MADTLAEIVNTTVTAENLDDGEHTLFTTDGSTTQVIKDITLKKGPNVPDTFSASLDVNGFNVATFTDSASGTEIVAPNSTVKIKSPTYPLEVIELTFQNTASSTSITADSVYSVEGIFDNTIVDRDTTVSGISLSTQQYFATQRHGDLIFQRHLPSSTGFYLRILNVSTTQTITDFSQTYRPTAYDWENDRFVCIESTSMNFISTADASQTSITIVDGPSDGSYARFSVAGGYAFLHSGNNGVVDIYKMENGFSKATVGGLNTVSGNDKFVVSYNDSTEQFHMIHYTSDVLRQYNVNKSDLTSGASFSVSQANAVGTSNGTNYHFINPSYVPIPTAIGKYQYYIKFASPYNEVMRLDASDITKLSESMATLNDSVPYAYPVPKKVTTSEATTAGVDFSDYSIGIRATGVTVS